ncbi:MAG: nuclear transport factor 2 family protein [Parvularculaceae bacterium]
MAAAAIDLDKEAKTVAAIDTAYQAAVERNDAETMAKILHEGFTLVLGTGQVYDREDLLNSARTKHVHYDVQVEEAGTQTVRMYGPDVAIVTALLRIEGKYSSGEPIFRRLWFSDTYVRTSEGWRYAFGQASVPFPEE